MILFPPAKINLGLNVLFKREDGYHEIDTCMVSIPLFDVLEILPSDKFEFKQTGLKVDGDTSNNLIVKAYELLKSKYNLPPVFMHLQKHIPMGAGLGGGSADASYTLLGLNQLFDLKLQESELLYLAGQLGSDCPFFILDEPQIASGRGELLAAIPIELKGYYLKIVNPVLHIGTKEAYAAIQFSDSKKLVKEVLHRPIEDWKKELKNDFEFSAFGKFPQLADIKEKLYAEGAIYASMTGSGSTLYSIYFDKPTLSFPEFFERVLEL